MWVTRNSPGNEFIIICWNVGCHRSWVASRARVRFGWHFAFDRNLQNSKIEKEKSNQPRVHHLNKFENSHVKIAKSRYVESIEWSQIRNTLSVMQYETSQRSGTEGSQKRNSRSNNMRSEKRINFFSLRLDIMRAGTYAYDYVAAIWSPRFAVCDIPFRSDQLKLQESYLFYCV